MIYLADCADDKAILANIYRYQMTDYGNWPLFPGSTKFMKSESPHALHITVHVNSMAFDAIESNAQAMPNGSIVVADNYNDNLIIESILMKKKITNRWFWGLITPNGTIESAGFDSNNRMLVECINCHSTAPRDFTHLWQSEIAPNQ